MDLYQQYLAHPHSHAQIFSASYFGLGTFNPALARYLLSKVTEEITKEKLVEFLCSSSVIRHAFACYIGLADDVAAEFVLIFELASTLTADDPIFKDSTPTEIMNELCRYLCGLLTRRNACKSWMCRLPTELMQEIFWYVWDDVPDEMGWMFEDLSDYEWGTGPSMSPNALSLLYACGRAPGPVYLRLMSRSAHPWIILSSVCVKWADIITDTKSIWASHSLSFLIKSNHSFERIPFAVELARRAVNGGRSIDFTMITTRNWDPLDVSSQSLVVLRHLYEYVLSENAGSLTIRAPQTLLHPLLSLSHHSALSGPYLPERMRWPALHTLTLALTAPYRAWQPDTVETFLVYAPLLRRVSLIHEFTQDSPSFVTNVKLDSRTWGQLTHLTLREASSALDPISVREIFRWCARSLKYVEIRMRGWEARNSDLRGEDEEKRNRIVVFPHLAHLLLDFNTYISNDAHSSGHPLGRAPNLNYSLLFGLTSIFGSLHSLFHGETENKQYSMRPMLQGVAFPNLKTLRLWTPVVPMEISPPHRIQILDELGLPSLLKLSSCFQKLKHVQLMYPGFIEEELVEFLRGAKTVETLDLRMGAAGGRKSGRWDIILREMVRTLESNNGDDEMEVDFPPELERYRYRFPAPLYHIPTDSAPSNISLPQDEEGSDSFLPNLKSLLISKCDHSDVDEDLYWEQAELVLRVVQSRGVDSGLCKGRVGDSSIKQDNKFIVPLEHLILDIVRPLTPQRRDIMPTPVLRAMERELEAQRERAASRGVKAVKIEIFDGNGGYCDVRGVAGRVSDGLQGRGDGFFSVDDDL